MQPKCDNDRQREEVWNLNLLATLSQKASELTWHDLTGRLRLLLELLAKIIGKEEVVRKSLVRENVLFMRTNGSIKVVLELES